MERLPAWGGAKQKDGSEGWSRDGIGVDRVGGEGGGEDASGAGVDGPADPCPAGAGFVAFDAVGEAFRGEEASVSEAVP